MKKLSVVTGRRNVERGLKQLHSGTTMLKPGPAKSFAPSRVTVLTVMTQRRAQYDFQVELKAETEAEEEH
jgi:hypothetical protein